MLLEGRAAYPVEGVGEGVFAEIGEDFVVNLEGGEVCWRTGQIGTCETYRKDLRDWRIASSENASIGVAS